jgi:RNA polymerase sigma-70 factor (ECF subfamily)
MNPDAERRFREAYQAHLPSVYAYFKRRTDVQTAQDATAETFLVAWRRIERMPEGDRALPWLYSVARRVLANQYRSQRRRARLAEKVGAVAQEPTPTPETIVMRNRQHEEVLAALARLKPDDQELLRLAVWEELPHRLIAEALSCSRHAVDQRIYRAAKRLAREMQHAEHIHVGGTTPDEQTGTL